MSEGKTVKLIFKQANGSEDVLEVDERLIEFSDNLRMAYNSATDGTIRIPGEWIRKSDLEIISNFYKIFNYFSDEQNQDLHKNNPFFSFDSRLKSEDLVANIGKQSFDYLKIFQVDGRDFNLSPESLNEQSLNNCLRICYHLRGFKHFNAMLLRAVASFFYRGTTFDDKTKWDDKHENRGDEYYQDEKIKLMGDKYRNYFGLLNQEFIAAYITKNPDFKIERVEEIRRDADEQSKKNEEIRAKNKMRYLE